MKNLVLLVVLILVAFSWAGKTLADSENPWKKVGVAYSEVQDVINTSKCYYNTDIFVGCIAALNNLVSYYFGDSEKAGPSYFSINLQANEKEKRIFQVDYSERVQGFLKLRRQYSFEKISDEEFLGKLKDYKKEIEEFREISREQTAKWKKQAPALIKEVHKEINENNGRFNPPVHFDVYLDAIEKNIMSELAANRATQVLVDTISEYLKWAFDGHSSVIPQEIYRKQTTFSKETIFGIGVRFSTSDGYPLIESVIKGGPTFKSEKIFAGDRIVEVYDPASVIYKGPKDLKGFNSEDVVKLLKGKKSTSVFLTIEREGKKIEEPIEIVRGKVELKNVDFQMLNESKIGYIDYGSFSLDSSREIVRAVQQLEGAGAEGLILDLRGNPGGIIDEAVNIADIFLGPNKSVVTLKGVKAFEGQVSSYHTKQSVLSDLPLVILIDQGSASASELLSGALRDYKKAILVGTKTFGKGTVQIPVQGNRVPRMLPSARFKTIDGLIVAGEHPLVKHIPFTDRGDINFRMTTGRFYQPNGMSNQKIGIYPHFEVGKKPGPVNLEGTISEASLVNVPAEDGEKVIPQPSAELSNCVEDQGQALQKYNQETVKLRVDFQLESAKDVARCLIQQAS